MPSAEIPLDSPFSVHFPSLHGETFVRHDPSGIEEMIASLPPLMRDMLQYLQEHSPLRGHYECCLLIGGTLVAVESAGGARPGMGVIDVLEQPYAHPFSRSRGNLPACMLLPQPGSPYYFGPAVDSSLLQPEDFIRIAEICYALMQNNDVGRITLVTGTDTAEYLAAALTRMISHPSKQIVLIASMRKVGDKESDALPNFHEGRMVCSHMDPGIYLYLDRDVHDARRVSKRHSSAIDAFVSVGAEPVATFRHDFHPFIELGLNYIRRDDLLDYYSLSRNLEEAWQRCKRTGLPHERYHVNFHLVPEAEKEAAFAPFRNLSGPFFDRYRANGMISSERELTHPPEPILNTKLDNCAYFERMTPGYRAEWLRSLLEREDIHGVILAGISEVPAETRSDLLAIIAEYADVKPIVTFEDAERPDLPQIAKFHKDAELLGAIPSNRVTAAFGTITLKWLLGQGLPIEDIRTAWKFAEHTGAVGYFRKDAPLMEQEPPQISSGIRYVHLVPGYESAWLEAILEHPDTEALILGGFGAGNIPFKGQRELLSVLERYAKRIPVVMRTQCDQGPTDMEAYETGQAAKKAGVLSAGERTLYQTLVDLDKMIMQGESFL